MPDRHDRVEAADLPCTKRPAEDYFEHVNSKQAKRLCAGCPRIAKCLQWALNEREQGVWGGTIEQQREYLRRKAAA